MAAEVDAMMLGVELIVGVLSGIGAFFGLGKVERVLRHRREQALIAPESRDRRRTDRHFTEGEAMGYRVGMGEHPDSVRLRRGTPRHASVDGSSRAEQ